MSEKAESQNAENNEEKSGKTVLYCMTRDSLNSEDLLNIRNALENEGYILKASEDGDNVMIQRESMGSAVDIQDVLNS